MCPFFESWLCLFLTTWLSLRCWSYSPQTTCANWGRFFILRWGWHSKYWCRYLLKVSAAKIRGEQIHKLVLRSLLYCHTNTVWSVMVTVLMLAVYIEKPAIAWNLLWPFLSRSSLTIAMDSTLECVLACLSISVIVSMCTHNHITEVRLRESIMYLCMPSVSSLHHYLVIFSLL